VSRKWAPIHLEKPNLVFSPLWKKLSNKINILADNNAAREQQKKSSRKPAQHPLDRHQRWLALTSARGLRIARRVGVAGRQVPPEIQFKVPPPRGTLKVHRNNKRKQRLSVLHHAFQGTSNLCEFRAVSCCNDRGRQASSSLFASWKRKPTTRRKSRRERKTLNKIRGVAAKMGRQVAKKLPRSDQTVGHQCGRCNLNRGARNTVRQMLGQCPPCGCIVALGFAPDKPPVGQKPHGRDVGTGDLQVDLGKGGTQTFSCRSGVEGRPIAAAHPACE
jgi:hypothetical protein